MRRYLDLWPIIMVLALAAGLLWLGPVKQYVVAEQYRPPTEKAEQFYQDLQKMKATTPAEGPDRPCPAAGDVQPARNGGDSTVGTLAEGDRHGR